MFLVVVTVEPFGTKLTSTSPRGQFAAIARSAPKPVLGLRSPTSQSMNWPPHRSGSSTTGTIGSIAHQRTLGSCEPDNLEQLPSAHARHSLFITDPACPRHPLRSPRSIPV